MTNIKARPLLAVPTPFGCPVADADDSKGGWIRYLNVLKLRAETDPTKLAKLEKRMNQGVGHRQ